MFPNVHRRFIQKFKQGDTILVEGKIENSQYPVKIIVNKITNADELISKSDEQEKSVQTKVLYIRFESLNSENKKLQALQEILKENRGNVPVVIFDQETKKQKPFKKEFHARIDENLLEMLKIMFGNENVVLKAL